MSRAPSGASRISRAGTAEKLSVILLLAFFLFLGLNAARSQGQTVDETFYNGAGYPMVRYQDYRFLGEHPPFAMQWGSLPLLFLQPKFPINKPVRLKGQQGMDISANGARFLYTQGNDPYVLLFLERMMILLLGLLTGVMLYAWAKSLAGAGGALAALTLFILNPDILAHGSLFTSDLPVTAFFFGACAAAAAWFRTGHFRILAAAGILTGLALLSKMSALVLIPGLSLLFVLDILENRNRPPRP